MEFLSVAHSDTGIKKSTNQDSVLMKEAVTDFSKVLLCVVCDGMGGLAKGEVASASLIRAFSYWFENEFPHILYDKNNQTEFCADDLWRSWDKLIGDTNRKIEKYGAQFHAALGTTVSALLLINNHYYITNIGDTRVYMIRQALQQITKDHTYVQREIDQGRMTPEQALVDPQRNVLLQCVGASQVVIPDFYQGTFERETIFMLCSDGFRHQITPEEIYSLLNPGTLKNEKNMRDAAIYCTELNKQRKETDNISVILVRTY